MFFLARLAPAQVAEVTLQVNVDGLSAGQQDLLRDFASDLKSYLGDYNWGGGNPADKVKVTLTILVQSVSGEIKFSAQAFVGSQRPIYNSDKGTAVLRLMDESWEFTYVRNRPITHNSYQFSDLTSFLDFYMYLIMAYDADTFEKMSGTQLLQKAADVVSLGKATGQRGWLPSNSSYSRAQLIAELAQPNFEAVRSASYLYHFCGLDSLKINADRARANILQALETIGKVRSQVDPRNLVIKTFFDTKYLEIASIFADYPDPKVYYLLSRIDPAHQATYEEYRQKRP
jgi:hypothetical protein